MEKDTAEKPRFDLNRATALTPEADEAINQMFFYHPWDPMQQRNGVAVREILRDAVKLIVKVVPPCPDRSSAIRLIRQARMEANSAITHRGKY